jgi:hypothetical protein
MVGSWGGVILNYDKLRGDIQRWDAWYSVNGSRIDMTKIADQLPYQGQP